METVLRPQQRRTRQGAHPQEHQGLEGRRAADVPTGHSKSRTACLDTWGLEELVLQRVGDSSCTPTAPPSSGHAYNWRSQTASATVSRYPKHAPLPRGSAQHEPVARVRFVYKARPTATTTATQASAMRAMPYPGREDDDVLGVCACGYNSNEQLCKT